MLYRHRIRAVANVGARDRIRAMERVRAMCRTRGISPWASYDCDIAEPELPLMSFTTMGLIDRDVHSVLEQDIVN
jgi:hypothetical protein